MQKKGHQARLGENNRLFSEGTDSLKEILLLRFARALVHAQITQNFMCSSDA